MYEMIKTYFKNDEEITSKLKEVGIFTKTKTSSDLQNLKYKTIVNNELKIYNCEILAINTKENPKECINPSYENFTIQSNGKTFDINIEFLKDMQKKSFGSINESAE